MTAVDNVSRQEVAGRNRLAGVPSLTIAGDPRFDTVHRGARGARDGGEAIADEIELVRREC